jgi:hypothetical protein
MSCLRFHQNHTSFKISFKSISFLWISIHLKRNQFKWNHFSDEWIFISLSKWNNYFHCDNYSSRSTDPLRRLVIDRIIDYFYFKKAIVSFSHCQSNHAKGIIFIWWNSFLNDINQEIRTKLILNTCQLKFNPKTILYQTTISEQIK